MIRHALDVWYKDGLRFTCTQCGNCCSGAPGYVWVTKQDIENIARFLGYADGRLPGKYVRRVGVRRSLTEKPGGDCIFLRRTRDAATCAIYPVRPTQCRTWPFWNQNLRTQDAWHEAAKDCPGMDQGEHRDLDEIEARRGRQKF